MNDINIAVVRTHKAFLKFLLSQMRMQGLETAIALEELASEIRQKLAREWADENQH